MNIGSVLFRGDGTLVDVKELNKVTGGSLNSSCVVGVCDKCLLMGGDGGGLSIGGASDGSDLFKGSNSCEDNRPFNVATGGSFIGNGGGNSLSLGGSSK